MSIKYAFGYTFKFNGSDPIIFPLGTYFYINEIYILCLLRVWEKLFIYLSTGIEMVMFYRKYQSSIPLTGPYGQKSDKIILLRQLIIIELDYPLKW